MASFDDLRAGISINEALDAFRAGCNKPNETLWITESWITPRFERLRTAIRGPLTTEQATVLRAAVLKTVELDAAIEWICDHPGISWPEYRRLVAFRAWERKLDAARREYEDWHAAVHGGPTTTPEAEAITARLDDGKYWPLPTPRPHFPIIERRVTEPRELRDQYISTAKDCPLCGMPAERLTWSHIYVRKHYAPLAGHQWEGWVTICERCKIGVQNFSRYLTIY